MNVQYNDESWCTTPESFIFPNTSIDYNLGVRILNEFAGLSLEESKSEVTRYCGLPGQALCYKLGEKKILELRKKSKLNIKDFHDKILSFGSVDFNYIENYFRKYFQ